MLNHSVLVGLVSVQFTLFLGYISISNPTSPGFTAAMRILIYVLDHSIEEFTPLPFGYSLELLLTNTTHCSRTSFVQSIMQLLLPHQDHVPRHPPQVI